MLRGAEVICRRKNAAATPPPIPHCHFLPSSHHLYFFSAHFMTTRSRQWSPSRSRRCRRRERDFASFGSLLCFLFFTYFLCYVFLLQFPLDLCIFIAKYIMRIIVVADDFYDYSYPITKGVLHLCNAA